MVITDQELKQFIDQRYIKRGKEIVQSGNIILKKISEKEINALAYGTSIYTTKLFRKGKALNGTCTRQAFFQWGPCKHLAATDCQPQNMLLIRIQSHDVLLFFLGHTGPRPSILAANSLTYSCRGARLVVVRLDPAVPPVEPFARYPVPA